MIFVDSLFITVGKRRWCHMVSDASLEELHAFAKKLGLKREWFQDKKVPHYDITENKRRQAISMGAREAKSRQELLGLLKEEK